MDSCLHFLSVTQSNYPSMSFSLSWSTMWPGSTETKLTYVSEVHGWLLRKAIGETGILYLNFVKVAA